MQTLKRPYLGELEMAVLEYLWSHGEFDAKGVYSAVGKTRGISHNTIQSTLERLFKKKLLAREKISHAYVYQAKVGRDELMSRMINDVVNTISKNNADGMLAAFVDIAARTDEAHLDRLEQLINEYRLNSGNDSAS
ncbi:BlaI/MecI/CopY family transcriptional regulator [Methylicorpusculum sp.]|uniref:BlaI/MecI/CopY family transcriptional regulator n=1 Tax=Methylicorpusculum sp. TaxID=2713644 RepID=UPI002ABA71AA|nr:BlaI/MecI/CopY family transcriptional regulator [Methylicorpusculum sp.]MDZ4149914.1 BlaI/MecI/CopY family transcriptional regulator [Methylicorpusculum sp.]